MGCRFRSGRCRGIHLEFDAVDAGADAGIERIDACVDVRADQAQYCNSTRGRA
jgi:hypothetical protein